MVLRFGRKLQEFTIVKPAARSGSTIANKVSVKDHLWMTKCIRVDPCNLFYSFLKDYQIDPLNTDSASFFESWILGRSMEIEEIGKS
eukprot:CAMPEP_0196577846 /NCGR_PEP_ID=MMETSP1081-20130531/6857_1 /TAXON_ID=36882 /ORGANISM="Pyramimonas amylifera, Strain CCMP720" /LENGTH=86 /DNA_ID=CAMNT_0041896887 /DNA_START=69 /DNA_END=325 /DNA_ORIENTATION=+